MLPRSRVGDQVLIKEIRHHVAESGHHSIRGRWLPAMGRLPRARFTSFTLVLNLYLMED